MRPIQGQRANVTTPTPQWPSTWPIQGQRDCHIRYVDLQYIISFYETYPGPIRQHSMTSTFNDLLRDIRHCHLQYANIQWASTRPIQAQRDCHIRYVHLQYIISFYDGWVPVVGHVRTGYDRSDGPKARDRDHFVHGTIHWARVQCRRPHTYNTPTFNELLRDLSKPSVTAIYDMYTFNTYTRYIKDQCDYANPNMIRQPFTEFIRGISRANMTAMYEMQTFNTYSRYIQDQRDWHMPYTMRQPFNELLRGISSSTWLRQPVTEFLRGISRTNVTRPTQIWSANPSLSLYEVYPGPTW
jgi:hypothetical protein